MPAVNLHSKWRDLDAFKQYGFNFSTTSNEAVKLWDAALTQCVGWYVDENMGGFEKTVMNMTNADPYFAMGKVLSIGQDLLGRCVNTRTDPTLLAQIDELDKLSKNCHQWERQHVKAIKLWSEGRCNDASLVWEDLLLDNPLDFVALKFSHDNYHILGQLTEMRDSSARVFPYWNETIPLYGYLHGLHSFGLSETNLFPEAEIVARKGVEINAQDAWSAHSLVHVFESQGRIKEGLNALDEMEVYWRKCDLLACHNYWHWSLFHFENNDDEAALAVFDNELSERCRSGTSIDIVDACSLLYRLEMTGIKVGWERWEHMYEICRPHLDDHFTAFDDIHLLMSFLCAKKPETTKKFIDSIRNYIENISEDDDLGKVSKDYCLVICRAMQAYDSGEFDQAVKLLLPIRYKIVDIGSSNAQRDVFRLLLVNAALKSEKYHKLSRSLIIERKAMRKDTPLNERLMAKWFAKHELST